MSVVTVRLNGLLSSDSKEKNIYQVFFKGKRMKLRVALSKMACHVSAESVAFLAINGVKAVQDSWVTDGDLIDIFPVVSGG